MSSVSRGHGAERDWMKRLQQAGRFACRPRWALVDVLSMRDGHPTYFDEVKTDQSNPYANFKPKRRAALKALAALAGATPRLIWWPDHGKNGGRLPRVIPANEWPD